VVRSRGGDDRAQLLTLTIAGSGVFESSLISASSAPRGPIIALIEWGIRGARAKAEVDIPQGGVVFSLVASYVQVAARYDGMVLVNGAQLDPEATGSPNPGPSQRVAAMVGYGSYGPTSRLTRTFRLNDVPPPPGIPDVGPVSDPVRVPAFARRVQVMGLGLDAASYRVLVGTFDSTPNTDVAFGPGSPSRAIDLPGDAGFVQVENLGSATLANPTLVFEIGL
jgi:hypothetical protein